MHQSYKEFVDNVVVIQNIMQENNKFLPQIQKISSSNEFVALAIRFYKKNLIIFLGRGGNGNGLYSSNINIPASLRIKDRYLDFLRSVMSNGYIEEISIHSTQKIVQFKLQKFEDGNKIQLFVLIYWKGRECYFVIIKRESQLNEILKSWIGNWQNLEYPLLDNFDYFHEVLLSSFAQVEDQNKTTKIITGNEKLKKYFDFQLNKIENSIRKKKILKQEKKIRNITDDYRRLKMWEEFYELFKKNEGQFLNSDIGLVEYKEIKFKIDSRISYYQKRSLIYEKCKKAAKNVIQVEERISKEKLYLKQLKEMSISVKSDTQKSVGKVLVPVWNFNSNSKSPEATRKQNEDFVIIQSPWGEIAIGKNAQGNEHLRKNWGSKDDLWFHIDNETSAHLFIKIEKFIDSKMLEIIGSILKDYSRLNSNEINLIYTNLKYLKSIKGKMGAVRYKNEKRIRVYYNPKWKEIISAPLQLHY